MYTFSGDKVYHLGKLSTQSHKHKYSKVYVSTSLLYSLAGTDIAKTHILHVDNLY